MAEAKRAGGEYRAAATLLEESVRVLDASGQGESAVACRRMERLAQAQGDLNGDHAAAGPARVLERGTRRERRRGVFGRRIVRRWLESSLAKPKSEETPHETKARKRKRVGFVGAAAAAAHGGAVASAEGARGGSPGSVAGTKPCGVAEGGRGSRGARRDAVASAV